MRCLLPALLVLSCAAAAPAADDALPSGYWAVDALVLPQLHQVPAKDQGPVIRRYYLKDPRTVVVGQRALLVGDGIIDGQVGGSVAVPADTVVAMLRYANNQEFVRGVGRGDPAIGR